MSTLEGWAKKAVEKGADNAFKKAPEWFDAAMGKARAVLPVAGGTPEQSAVRFAGVRGLEVVASQKGRLLKLGEDGLRSFLGHVAIGRSAQGARMLTAYGGGQGAWGAADAAVAGTGDHTEQTKRDHDELVTAAKEIGAAAAKAVLPLLLAL